jgi:hypothetical protein
MATQALSGGAMSAPDPGAAAARLRVVRGDPTAEELAVVAAVVAAAASAQPAPARPVLRGRWNDPTVRHRRSWLPGPGAWRATGWSQ